MGHVICEPCKVNLFFIYRKARTSIGRMGGGVPFDAHFRFLARNSLRRRVDLLGSVKGNELDCTRRIRAKLNVQHVAIDRLHL